MTQPNETLTTVPGLLSEIEKLKAENAALHVQLVVASQKICELAIARDGIESDRDEWRRQFMLLRDGELATLRAEHAALADFVKVYDAWYESAEHIDGPKFEAMVEGRAKLIRMKFELPAAPPSSTDDPDIAEALHKMATGEIGFESVEEAERKTRLAEIVSEMSSRSWNDKQINDILNGYAKRIEDVLRGKDGEG